MSCSKLIPLNFDIYDLCKDKKELDLTIDISDFDKSKVSLIKSEVNPNNFKTLYDGQKFPLKVDVLNGKLKQSRCFEDAIYLSIKDNCVSNRIKLNQLFECLKEKTTDELTQDKKESEILNSIGWNKIWMGFSDYDLTEKHIYHFKNVCLAIDQVTSVPDECFRMYRLECSMIAGSVVMCKNCDTFFL